MCLCELSASIVECTRLKCVDMSKPTCERRRTDVLARTSLHALVRMQLNVNVSVFKRTCFYVSVRSCKSVCVCVSV